MKCQKVKPGIECTHWKKSGCTFPGGICQPVVEQCLTGGKNNEGCSNIMEFNGSKYCTVFAEPAAKWEDGLCNFATHRKAERKVIEQKINPLKAAKRAQRQGRGV